MQAAVQYNLDAYNIYDTISLSRKYGKGKDLTFHEYVAAAMHNRFLLHHFYPIRNCNGFA